jgi:hypothetical protein
MYCDDQARLVQAAVTPAYYRCSAMHATVCIRWLNQHQQWFWSSGSSHASLLSLLRNTRDDVSLLAQPTPTPLLVVVEPTK